MRRLTFRSIANKQVFIRPLETSGHYFMVNPGAEFTIESVWRKAFDDWKSQGLFVLVASEDLPGFSKQRYRSIDDD